MRQLFLALVCTTLCFTNTFAQQPRPQGQTAPATPAPPPGQPEVTFKAEVNYVDVDTIVTDQQGRFVTGLKKEDFQLYEDGKPQKIEMFSYVDLPITPAPRPQFASRPIVDDVRTNQQSAAGRLYVILLDDLDTSLFRSVTVKRSAHEFVEKHLGPNDVAAVVYSSGRSDAAQEFTSDRSLLLTAIDKFVGRKLRSAMFDKIDEQYRQAELNALAASSGDPNGPAPATNNGALSQGSSTDPSINPYTRGDGYPDRTFDSDDMERGYRALRVLGEIRDIADFMGSIHGRRKALLLFSEGIDYDVSDVYGAQEATQVISATQDAITAAARGNVSIFGVDPRGLVGMSADAMSLDSPGPGANGPQSSANLMGFNAEMRLSQDSLRSLSDETGGFASLGNRIDDAFDRIVRANSTYYVLGYYPPSHPRDGRFHKIEVRTTRPGLKVTARRGYADPRGKTPEERAKEELEKMQRDSKKGGADTTTADLRAVLNSPMQQGGIPMLIQAAPFRVPPSKETKDQTVAMAIEIDSRAFRFEQKNNVYNDNLELSYFSMNEQGKPLMGTRKVLDLSLKPDTYERVRATGVRINERVPLAPGRYQLRIGLRESGSGAMGTLFYDLQVPDFAKEPLSMSGMLLTAATSPIVPTVVADKQLTAEQLPGPITSRRAFAQGDELAVYTEVYDTRSQNHTVDVTTRLLSDDGREVFNSRETHPQPAQSNNSVVTYGIAKRISLKDVPPGSYLLQVQAEIEGMLKDIKPVTRETVLTILPDK